MMIDVASIDHIVLYTYDKYDDMLHFYCQVLSGRIVRKITLNMANEELTQIKLGSKIIDLHANTQTPLPTCHTPNMAHFCLTIKQPINSKLIQYLNQQGINCSPISNNFGAQGFGDAIYIHDPCNNMVELKQLMQAEYK